MKILQSDVNMIKWELVKPEAIVYEKEAEKEGSVEDALVLFIAIEKGDSEALAKTALKEAVDFAGKLKRSTLVLYPFAHLSSNLEEINRAMALFNYMVKEAEKTKMKVVHSAFGWNKAFSLDVKGHPMAEQYKSYGAEGDGKKAVKQQQPGKKREIDTSIVRKSVWVDLPEGDHRLIGERQDLFSFQEVSPAMVYWHPNGLIIFMELLKFIREKELEYGYQEISTPVVNNIALFKVSGHSDHFADNMFIFDSDTGTLGLKPMNCPSTILIYKSRKWSYRELPFRTATFDKLYRSELSGVTSGLFRVREMTQDDGHIFVREDQMQEELSSFIKMVTEIYATFGIPYKVYLATMPDDHAGDTAVWEKATSALTENLKANKIKYEVKEKEGAFYGPKLEFHITDSLGRAWQCGTAQVDYNMPRLFGMEYVGEDGKAHIPVNIHRAALGTLERFIGVMIEHYKGKFPSWLAPVQVRVITISEQANDYAKEVLAELKKNMIRAELDASDKTLEYKIRDGQLMQIPYMVILGKKEMDGKKISVRSRSGKQKMGISLGEFLAPLKDEIAKRKNELML